MLNFKSLGSRYFLVIIFFILGIASLYSPNIHLDEKESHLPTVRYFMEEPLITAIKGEGYKSASTPLPYIMVSSLFTLMNINADITSVRIFNTVISAITIFIFYLIIQKKSKNVYAPLLILFFYPYYLKPTFSFFMSIYGLLFFLIFIYYFLQEGERNRLIALTGLSFAILSQQFYLIVVPFVLLYELIQIQKIGITKKNVGELIFSYVPFILPLLLYFYWGGLTHPQYKSWGVELSFTNFTSVLTVLGSILLPFTIVKLKSIELRTLILVLILSLLLVIFAFPKWVIAPTIGGITGYTFHTLEIVSRFNFIAGFGFKFLLVFLGGSGLIVLYRVSKIEKLEKIYFLLPVLILGFSLNKLPSERHMLPLVVTAYLIIFSYFREVIIIRYWVLLQTIIGGSYFYYLMFGSSVK